MLLLGRLIGRLRFLPFGLRDRILRLAFPPQSRRDYPFVASIGTARIAGNLDNYLDWSVFFYGQYERYLLAFLASIVRQMDPAPVFWDIGANNGQHSLFVAGLGAKVEAFEPFEPVRRKLLHSLTLNPTLAIRVHAFGLGAADCDLAFVQPDNENMATGHFDPDGSLILPIRRGDGVDAPLPDLMKIDVEGFEGDVLRGLASTLETARPIIVCEFSERTKERDGDLRRLIPHRYLTYVVTGIGRPRIVAYEGNGRGEMILFLPAERKDLIA